MFRASGAEQCGVHVCVVLFFCHGVVVIVVVKDAVVVVVGGLLLAEMFEEVRNICILFVAL